MAVPRDELGEGIRQEAGGTEAASALSEGTPAPAQEELGNDPARDPRLFRARGTYRPWYVRETGPLGRWRRD